MGRYGAAYGLPFGVEGIFFFIEAIFVAIYIYGWRRLSPWAHFWSGVPVTLAGLGGTLSVVAANGWMNQPAGITVVDQSPSSTVGYTGAASMTTSLGMTTLSVRNARLSTSGPPRRPAEPRPARR
jgi:cytochrome bd-type quinol oxidase subunit 1